MGGRGGRVGVSIRVAAGTCVETILCLDWGGGSMGVYALRVARNSVHTRALMNEESR